LEISSYSSPWLISWLANQPHSYGSEAQLENVGFDFDFTGGSERLFYRNRILDRLNDA
jgi:hypothetical protein